MPHLPEISRRGAALIVAAALVAAGCSSGGQPAKRPPAGAPSPSAPPAPPAAGTVTNAQMCQDLSNLRNLFAQVGYDQSLSATRSDLARLVATVVTDLAQGPPKAVSGALAAVVADLKVVNQWVQTQATQTDLNNNNQPSNVKKHYTDIGVQYKTIDSWSAKNCP